MGDDPAFRDLTGGSTPQHAAIEAAVRGFRTLEDVVRWQGVGAERPTLAEATAQDEYTHDIVFACGHGVFVVFDTP